MDKQPSAVVSLVDHLIAADYALAQVGNAAADPALEGQVHAQDMREWMDQLRARLDAVAV